ncbi:MAG: hypothetical protein ABRQ39_09305 [Candidatus Eremiobacterota bacterium]
MDGETKVVRQEGKSPLAHFGDETLLRRHINNYMNLEQTGDIVIFGEYDGKDVEEDFY